MAQVLSPWHINNFSVTPVTDPPGREPDSSRPGTRTKTFMFLGFRTQHINSWPLATGRETPTPPGRETPPPARAVTGKICLCLCAFSFPDRQDMVPGARPLIVAERDTATPKDPTHKHVPSRTGRVLFECGIGIDIATSGRDLETQCLSLLGVSPTAPH